MKKVFKAIGHFFAKIWGWIKDTAWVQPLLIVGLIFAVIFSIPSITKGINNLSENGAKYNFINNNYIYAKDLLKYEQDGTLVEKLGDQNETHSFLICIVEQDSDACTSAEVGFRYMFSTTGKKTYFLDDDHKTASVKFLYQWDKDDATNDDIKRKWRNDALSYVDWENEHQDEIEIAYLQTCEKYGLTSSDYGDDDTGKLTSGKLPAPSMILYENGVITEAYFGVNGSSKSEKADFIRDFYFHENTFDADLANK